MAGIKLIAASLVFGLVVAATANAHAQGRIYTNDNKISQLLTKGGIDHILEVNAGTIYVDGSPLKLERGDFVIEGTGDIMGFVNNPFGIKTCLVYLRASEFDGLQLHRIYERWENVNSWLGIGGCNRAFRSYLSDALETIDQHSKQ